MIFHNVPASQCEYCGEKYFEAKVLKQIEKEFVAVQNGKQEDLAMPFTIEKERDSLYFVLGAFLILNL